MQNIGMSMLWFWISYILVTLVGILHTIFNIYVLHMKPMDNKSMGEGYEKTKPWHPLYNIIIFTIFGFIYMNGIASPTLIEAFTTGAIWTSICIVFDIFGWVIIKHPWSLTFKEFYIDYQPWITLIYIAIFLGPILGFLFIAPKYGGANNQPNNSIQIDFEKSTFKGFKVENDIVYLKCELSLENTSEQDIKFHIRANYPEDVGKLLLNNDELLIKENGKEKVFELKAKESIKYEDIIFEGKFGGIQQKLNRLLTRNIKIIYIDEE